MFCRAISLQWTKEEGDLSRKICNDFYGALDSIQCDPIIVQVGNVRISLTVQAKYAPIDEKVTNSIARDKDTKACPLCKPGADHRVGPHFFHSRLNIVELMILLAV
uniref:(northern house mosquito) hypothetical protein n=1 Tax=Culex pipiens TaxID=7175 RepID=A0A8D8BYL3_CULPI